jgi:hypothetical protein
MLPEKIESKIYLIRGHRIMLDRDLAILYEVETKQLKRQVKRNIDRFPSDFAFELNDQEFTFWRRQFGTSISIKMGLRYRPLAFTEQGIAMLSSVLNSKRAVHVNIEIMRTFVRIRTLFNSHEKIWKEIEGIKKLNGEKFHIVFEAIKKLQQVELTHKRQIGFHMKN